MQDYVDAGADHICVMDNVPMIYPDEAADSLRRSIEVCEMLKANNLP